MVELGAHHYVLTEPLVVPNSTTVLGQSPDVSSISFVLAPPALPAQPLRAAVTVASGVALRNFSISLLVSSPAPTLPHNRFSQPAGTVAVLMPQDAGEFRAVGLRVTTRGNSSNAMRIEGAGFSVESCTLWQKGCVLNDGFEPSTTLNAGVPPTRSPDNSV